MGKIIFCIIYFWIFGGFAFANPIQPLIRYCMSAEVWQEEDWPNEPYNDFLDRCMEYQGNLQSFKQAKTTWGILNRNLQKKGWEGSDVLYCDTTTWDNLQLFKPAHENSPNSFLIHYIDRTSLLMGRRILELWVANPKPFSKIEEVQKRQKIAQYLMNNGALFQELDEQFSILKKSENFFLSFWLNDPLLNACKKSYFHSLSESMNTMLNRSPLILGASAVWSHFQRATQCVSSLCGLSALSCYAISPSFIGESTASSYLGMANPLFAMAKNGCSSLIQSSYVRPLFYAGAALVSMTVVKESYHWANDNITLQKYLQEKMIHVASFFQAMKRINELWNHCDPSGKNSLSEAIAELTMPGSDLHFFLDLLETNTFSGSPHLLSSSGNIFTCYRWMHDLKEHFEDALTALGEIDVYMSIARLYKEFEDQNVKFSFAKFGDSPQSPMIHLQDEWNPFVNPSYAVANTIELGAPSHSRNMILTGPNEGGKSTFVKGVTMNLILAQSLGICAATSAFLTPFDYIATYLNITDDDGKSLFEAQVKRAKYILDHIDEIAQDEKKVFVVMDEMFNGTDAHMGQSLAFNYAKYLGSLPNVIALFPTHFPFMTSLGSEDNFSNYCVTASYDSIGTVQFLYKMVPGIWTQNIALHILRHEGYREEFLEEVQNTFQSLDSYR